jgi:hypothetical protein
VIKYAVNSSREVRICNFYLIIGWRKKSSWTMGEGEF